MGGRGRPMIAPSWYERIAARLAAGLAASSLPARELRWLRVRSWCVLYHVACPEECELARWPIIWLSVEICTAASGPHIA